MDDHSAPTKFYLLSFDDFFLYCVLRDKAIHVDLILLANPVRSVHGLEIYLGIPIRVVNNHSVRGH